MINYSYYKYNIGEEYEKYLFKRHQVTTKHSSYTNVMKQIVSDEDDVDNVNNNLINTKIYLIGCLKNISMQNEGLFILQKKADAVKKLYDFYTLDYKQGLYTFDNNETLSVFSFVLLVYFDEFKEFSFLSTALKINDYLQENRCNSNFFQQVVGYELYILERLYEKA